MKNELDPGERFIFHQDVCYCGNVIYENGVLKCILTDEGYIAYTGSTPVYYYYLRDHLGNNRVVINSSGAVQQVNHYYAFGGLFGQLAPDVQRFKYNGKELDTANGLDLYDYHARQMDAALGRFTTVDPLAEKYYGMSPYGYVANNPMNAIDPSGEDVWVMNREGQLTWESESEEEELYFHDENGNRTSAPIIVKNRSILESLSANPDADIHYSATDAGDIEDVFKIFKGAADNTDVEWAIYMHNDSDGAKFTVGTNHRDNAVGGNKRFNIRNKPTAIIHSHPGVKNDMVEERKSMGHEINNDGKTTINDPNSDFARVRNDIRQSGSNATLFYVYMPNSRRVYHVHNYGTSYIRNAGSRHKRFFWGVFNNK